MKMTRFQIALVLAVVTAFIYPAALLCQDNSASETYDGVPFCHMRAGGGFPHLIHQTSAEYDDKDRRAKKQGVVTLSVIVTKEGTTADIKVTKSLTPGLDQQAIKSVSQWTFEPIVVDGQPCPLKMAIQVNFKLY
jgi:TonB family protein